MAHKELPCKTMKGTGKLLTSEHWQYTKNNTEIVDVGMAPDVWQACTKEAESADPSIAVLRTGASGGAHQEVRAPGLKKTAEFSEIRWKSVESGRSEFQNHRIYCSLFQNFKKRIKVSKNM
jgi:hypothetical protein